MLNNQTHPGTNNLWLKQQPGVYAQNVYNSLSQVKESTELDFAEYNKNYGTTLIFRPIGRYEVCPAGTYKVALVLTPSNVLLPDYHWYRQDADGMWSHKQGTTPVKRTDESGNLITDPQIADRGRYTVFVGYFAVSPWNNLYTSTYSAAPSTNLSTEEKTFVPNETINSIHIGMSMDEVFSIVGFSGVDIGSGAIIHQYKAEDGRIVNIIYTEIQGECYVSNIYQEEP